MNTSAQAQETQAWSGRTDEVTLPRLDADWWKPGRVIEGVFDGEVEMSVGQCFRLNLSSDIDFNGKKVSVVELPASTGVRAALESLRNKGYEPWEGDRWKVVCYAVRKSKKADFSDSPQFEIQVLR